MFTYCRCFARLYILASLQIKTQGERTHPMTWNGHSLKDCFRNVLKRKMAHWKVWTYLMKMLNSHHRATWQTLEVQIRHPWLCFVEDLDHVDLKLIQSPKRVHQNQQTGPGDSGCTWFLQLFRPGPHHNPFNEFKTKEIDNYSSWIGNLMYLNVFYVV